jgi:ubiquinone biosynthesis protein
MPGEVIGVMDFGIVGHLSERDRQNLIRFYLTAISLDTEEIVEQFIRIGAAKADVDRIGLERDIDRLLMKYHGLPLQDIRAGEVVEEIMAIALRHHLTLPADLWLLFKMASMMEGVGLKLDPKFDIFVVGEQYVKKLVWQLVLPQRTWSQSLIRQGADWSEFLRSLPRTGGRLMERVENGDLFQVNFKDTDRIISGVDRLTTRLALSMLAAALIIALAILIPITTPGSIVQWIVILGFIGAAGLGVWLLISMRKIIGGH